MNRPHLSISAPSFSADTKSPSGDVIHTSRVGVLLVIIGAAFVLTISWLGARTFLSISTPKEGISVFAILYIDAAFIERIVEPWSEYSTKESEKQKIKKFLKIDQPFGDTQKIKKMKLLMGQNGARLLAPEVQPVLEETAESLARQETKRVISFWGLNSLLAMLLVYFTVGLFGTMGAQFQDVVVAGRTIVGPAWDAILSGVIVGGGTKPLHDLIQYAEKSSS